MRRYLTLANEEVDRLLNSFTYALPPPRRGYAVVRLALDLGLRGIEISRLQLADIDWRLGTVTLKRTKSRRQDLLPLPVVTGRALEAYLRHERPKTSDAAVFVRRLAPHDEPIGVDAIRRIVRDAFRRVGIHRHAALPELRRRGTEDHRGHAGAAGDREDPD